MIEGIRVRVTTDELRAQIDKMIAFHMRRVGDLEKIEAGIPEVDDERMAQLLSIAKSMLHAMGPSTAHKDRVTYLAFLRDHLPDGETFLLDESDLHSLEFAGAFQNGQPPS